MKVVFLDIDGVLQPFNSRERFKYINTNIKRRLSCKYHIDYNKYDIYDICAVYYDWNKDAVNRLKTILDYTESKIIISSNWKDKNNKYKMRDLLKIHNLDYYWFCDNVTLKDYSNIFLNRASEIKDSLNKYDISNYVVIDDWYPLKEYFKDNFICTHNYIQDDDVINSIKILNK